MQLDSDYPGVRGLTMYGLTLFIYSLSTGFGRLKYHTTEQEKTQGN